MIFETIENGLTEFRRLLFSIRLWGAPGLRRPRRSPARKHAVLELQAYLNRLASADPTPGGGSAATIVGALGAGLIAMVARITLGSPRYAPVHAESILLIEGADNLRARFSAARTIDEAAYGVVPIAQALPRTSEAERQTRTERLQAALIGAAQAPLEAAELAGELIELCARTAALQNVHLMSDVECALHFGQAALAASAANVRVNHRFIKNEHLVHAQAHRLAQIGAAAADRVAATHALIAGTA